MLTYFTARNIIIIEKFMISMDKSKSKNANSLLVEAVSRAGFAKYNQLRSDGFSDDQIVKIAKVLAALAS